MDNFDDNINNQHDRSTAVIDLEAIRHNVREFRRLQRERRDKAMLLFCAVKADAYGHGAVQTAKAIAGLTDYMGVACIAEGIELRKAGITNPILVLGAELSDSFEAAVEQELTLTVFDIDRAKALHAAAEKLGKRANVHIAVDTGMSRIGLTPDEAGVEAVRQIAALDNIKITGAFTHFATADAADKKYAEEAHRRFVHFKRLCADNSLELGIWHCANTAATIDDIGLEEEMDMSRCGIGLYGLYPSDEVHKENVSLIPALKWFSCLSLVKTIKAGTSVSYGYNFTADKDTRIGTIACGYADGYRRILSPRGMEVIIRGRRCPIVGNICMDQMMVDLTGVPDAKPGDRVVLIGSAEDSFSGNDDNTAENAYGGKGGANIVNSVSAPITADEMAAKCDTISYEIVCALSRRTKRRYINV